jgi:hypothetical protein
MAIPPSSNRKSVIPKNEGRCLDATLRVLEGEHNATRSNLVSPEAQHDPYPVELVCDIGSKSFALEHTIIQSFDDQIGDGVKFMGVTEQLDLERRLPANVKGYFQVAIPVYATRDLRKHDVPAVRDALLDWVLKAAIRLNDQGKRGGERGTPTGLKFAVSIIWQPTAAPAKIQFARVAPTNEELTFSRHEQMELAIKNKLDKLKGWADKGAHDVLILEHWDTALSNIGLAKNSFDAIAPKLTYLPSSVYVVDTCMGNMWQVWALRRNGRNEVNLQDWSFDPVALCDPRR